MTTGIDVAVAATPLLLAGILLIGFLWPATRAMPVAWVAAIGVGYFAWNMPVNWLAAASAVGVMTAIEILWIVFGALVLLYTLMEAGAFDRINRGFATVSDDRRVQIVLIAFFMATFIEGAAGFGTPAAVVAPLLLGLGFPALAAVVAGIIGHIIAVTYGAVGTPIVVGIQSPMESVEFTRTAIQEGGMTVQEFSVNVAAWAATYHALVGFVMPLFAVGMVVYFFGDPDDRSLAPAWEVAPLCLASGIAFAVPYWISAWFLTAEFPSLIGSMVGGAIILSILRAGYLLPDDEWNFPDRDRWEDHWVGDIEPGQSNGSNEGASPEAEAADLSGGENMSLLKAWSPYVLLVVLLVVTRAVGPISNFINRDVFVVNWGGILGTDLSGAVAWMNVPGFWLLVSAVLAIPIFSMSGEEVSDAWKEAARKIVSPFIALVFVIAMVQVMLQSGSHPGAPEVGGMIVLLAQTTADILGVAYPAVAALIGALGAAMAGSNTVSNITFGAFQFEAATQLGLPRTIIVGAQAVGGAIGNLVAIHNLVAALATVGLLGQEGRVMRLNMIPLLYYSTGVGLLCLLFSYVLFPGVF
ncbi:L-lactate permease [Halorubrum sp. HHNYT27]|uniref:L-lactate permease n=1 Tax=Halorubrum sp. HHNYT27 TaxID=3402275 RepID=UPI003EB72BDB